MNKVDFLEGISYFKNEKNINRSVLANLLINLSYLYSDDIDFSVESYKTSIYISLKKYEQELDIDLINNFLDIRFNYVELNFFIDEIENDVLEKILKNILIGHYILYYSILDTGKVSSVNLVWKDSTLSNFNSQDLYEMTIIGNKVRVVEGFNWSR